MKNTLSTPFQAERWFYLFIFVHLLSWTLVPALVRLNLPLDAMEGTTWGHQLEWGYDKNPFMNGWLTALATYLDGQSGWMIYLFSQLSVVICFWVVWQLAKQMLTPAYALVSVMMLEGAQYFNFHAIDFNDNTLELSLWALTIYFFYQALRSDRPLVAWILTGVFAGLGMMAKYYTLALLAAMFLFLLLPPQNRKHLVSFGPYAGLITFLIIILPHTIWLFSHDFVTVTYVFDRASSVRSWTNHFFFPAQFSWQQAQVFLPALALFCLLLMGKKPLIAAPKKHLAPFDKAFLFYVGLGPFLLTVLLSFLSGIKLRAGWGMPLISFWGVIVIALVQPALTKAKLYRFIGILYGLTAACLIGYTVSLVDSPDPSTANFPGKEIASVITEEWRSRYNTKLSYVAGSRWVGGNISFYSKDRPAVFIEWDKRAAPWIDLQVMAKKGAVFVWCITDQETMPDEIRAKFPRLTKTEVLKFSYRRNSRGLEPIQIGIAYLPPEDSQSIKDLT